MSRKKLEHILNDVDDPEETLDDAPEVEAKAKTDEAEDTLDEPEQAAAKSETPTDKAEKEEDDKKDGLPPWMHARVKSATEAKTAAERRAEEAERRIAEYEQMLRQQNGQQQEPTIADYLQQLQAQGNWQNYETKRSFSRRFAVTEFGPEEVKQAEAWAYDACSVNPELNNRFLSSDDPVGDAVREFRKAQTFSELDKYGGDINKLIEAKLAERGAVQMDEPASPQATQRRMPGNFSGNPSARSGRSGPAYSGPKPLSDLLKE